ncbi:hypothetical protein OF897_11905 [Chryseobacterium formosus]|uniref:Uncharacterized protein n=1 Tax=Chryseobacterium formosus TaxID=1537363 RepID=A0ABT3XR64_9FLAO|nr:hypothetical protein [Chryseobacterium formosus]MCX8524618.1 hypothetical protein [Chryseobacterium formosus]
MDKNIVKLKKLVEKHLHQSKDEISSFFGQPLRKSDDFIWFFRVYKFNIFHEEIIFIFEEDKVVDIVLVIYFLWFKVKSIYYFENQNPEYKVLNFRYILKKNTVILISISKIEIFQSLFEGNKKFLVMALDSLPKLNFIIY